MFSIGLLVLVAIVLVVVALGSNRGKARGPVALRPRAHAAPEVGDGDPALARQLDEWREAGLLDAQQIAPILRYEEAKQGPRSRIPVAAEAVGYVGAALVFGAVALLVGNNFEDLAKPVRLVVLAVPAVAAGVSGWFAGRERDPAFVRLGSILWVLTAALVLATAAEVWVDLVHDGDPPDHGSVLVVGGAVAAWALAAYLLRKLPLQHLVLFAASLATALGVVDVVEGARGRTFAFIVWGLAVWAFGVLWTAGGVTEVLPPTLVARIFGGATVLVGAQLVRGDRPVVGLWLGFASAVALLLVGVGLADVAVLLVGAAGLFQWSPQLAIYYLEPAIGIEATLAVVGLLLIGAAVLLTRLYRRVRAEGEPAG